MALNSENMWNNMSKDVLNAKKVKLFDYLIVTGVYSDALDL